MRAFEWLISLMCPHVILERTGMGARKVALVTVERLFSGMSEHVCLKGTRP